jgi:hypothetical protein
VAGRRCVSGRSASYSVSLVNAFTNYRNVKGELVQKTGHVTDVTPILFGLCCFLLTPYCTSVLLM